MFTCIKVTRMLFMFKMDLIKNLGSLSYIETICVKKKITYLSTFLSYYYMTKVKTWRLYFFGQNTLIFYIFGTLKNHTYYHQRANLMILMWFLGITNIMVLIRSIFFNGNILVTILQVNRQVLWALLTQNNLNFKTKIYKSSKSF